MSGHDAVRDLLALAAAGALDPEDERRVARHVTGCSACAAELEAFRSLGTVMKRLPQPAAPPMLTARTIRRIQAELAAAADRRWDDALLAFSVLFAWLLGLTTWAVFRIASTGFLAILDRGFLEPLAWIGISSALAWLTAGVAVVMLGRRRTAWRTL